MQEIPRSLIFGAHAANAYCPPAELLLGDYLRRAPQTLTFRFGREIQVEGHIVSLCSRSARIAIEYDLPPKKEWTIRDTERIETLAMKGYSVVNIVSDDVYRDPNSLCNMLVSVANGEDTSNYQLKSAVVAAASPSWPLEDLGKVVVDDLKPRPRQGRLGRRKQYDDRKRTPFGRGVDADPDFLNAHSA